MRYLLFALVFTSSFLTNAQQVLSKFNELVFSEDFSSKQINFPQRYNANELFMLENDNYLVKRISPEEYSISYARTNVSLSSIRYEAEITLTKAKNNAGGIVIHGQQQTNGAIILEINSKKQFRVRKLFNGQEKIKSKSKKDGWIKFKGLSKKGKNSLEIRTDNGYYDIYINGALAYSVFDIQFTDGLVGLYVKGGSEMRVDKVNLYKKGSSTSSETTEGSDTTSTASTDESFEEVILLFKTKIDQQQAEIEKLQYEVDRCKSMLNYDTTLVSRAQDLEVENERLTEILDSTSKALSVAIKRLEYLESFREDVEAGSNGDLVLNLTTILADIKKENKKLKEDNNALKLENQEMEKTNDVLLREIERLKKLLEVQNE